MADEPTKLTPIAGSGDLFRGAVEELRRSIDARCEYHELLAKVRRSAFKAYVAEGFTEMQALELCKSV